VQRVQEELYALYGEGKLKPEITARYPLARFAEALARFESRQVQGKIVLLP
jgi:NADPH2:quinone reductase